MNKKNEKLSDWFHIKIYEDKFIVDKHPPDYPLYHVEVYWNEIERICFAPAIEWYDQDVFHVFQRGKENSVMIPMEADGGVRLWSEIIRRNLFDAELAIKASQSNGDLFVWPPEEK